jgi:hypothetical protein
VADGPIEGKRPDALPGPISELETPFRFGRGPSGSVACGDALAEDLGFDLARATGAEVTVTVSAAEGGVHFAVVAMLAVAVSVTEVTEVALDATGIFAWRATGCFAGTELIVQAAIPLPFAQPPVKAGFWLDGCEARVTDTFEAEVFSAETCTTNMAFCPRWTLDCERWTLTHSSGEGTAVLAVGVTVGLGLVAREASDDAETVGAAELEV